MPKVLLLPFHTHTYTTIALHIIYLDLPHTYIHLSVSKPLAEVICVIEIVPKIEPSMQITTASYKIHLVIQTIL